MEKSMAVAGTIEELKLKVRNNLHVHDDLALFILSKLPLKSLKRFGCVRKSWSLLFQNPHFMNMLRTHFSSRNSSDHGGGDTFLFLQEPELPVTHEYRYHDAFYLLPNERFEDRIKLDLPPPFQEDDSNIYVLCSVSVNGIFCLGQDRRRGIVNSFRAVLWNPATTESVAIPPSPDEFVPPYRDPFIHFHGFGYDHVRDDYKVIRYMSFFDVTDEDEDVPWEDRSYDPLLEIYSLRSNSWRTFEIEKCDMPDCVYDEPRTSSGVYMNGACHWWGNNDFYSSTGCLVSFDLSNEVLSTTPMPSDNDESCEFVVIQRHLVVLNESIALISNCNNTTTFHISILGELGVKESWIKLFIIGPMPPIECPIGVGKKGSICFKRKDDELVWIDLSTQIIEEIGVKGELFGYQMGIYKENLLPIGGIKK
jgi:molecular chaperone HtpG